MILAYNCSNNFYIIEKLMTSPRMIVSLLSIDNEGKGIENKYHNASSFPFFTRSSIKEIIDMMSVRISKEINDDTFNVVPHTFDNGKTYTFYCLKNEIISDTRNLDSVINFDNKQKKLRNKEKGISIKKIINIMVVSDFYPENIALMLLKNISDLQRKGQVVNLAELAKEYEDYKSKDLLSAVNLELGETTVVLKSLIEDLVSRGEKLDDLVANAEELSSKTKTLFKMSKKQNSCFGCGR